MNTVSGGQTGRGWKISIAACLVAVASVVPVAAQGDERETGWFNEAELSLVATDGNSQSETFSLRNTLRGVWTAADLKITLGGLRAASTDVTRTALGASAADARLVESSSTAVTAERYFFEARYDHRISDGWYWYASGGWVRNEPAGIKNRSSVAGGVGHKWLDSETARFRVDLAATYTDQQDVVEAPGDGGGFLGLRLVSDYWRQLTATTEYANLLTLDQNLDRSTDIRAEMVNSLSVRISDSLALRLSHELQFDNAPSLIAVPVFTSAGDAVGENLLIEADDVDTTLSVALVVGF